MPQRPNILLILTDQFRFDCLSRLGHPVVRTPNLDALAADGTLFTSAYCASMACGPARACLFTGRHADTHGILNNSTDFTPPDRPVLAERLADAGYDTALVGKLHLKPFERRFGFRHFLRHDAPYTNYHEPEARGSAYIKYLQQTVFRDDPEAPIRLTTDDEACLDTDEQRFMLGGAWFDEEHHDATWTAREATRYLREAREPDRPFFLNVSFFGPHQPYLCPGRWGEMYPPDQVPLPEGFDVSIEDKRLLRHSVQGSRLRRRVAEGWDEGVCRRLLSAYYGNVSMVDHYLGELFGGMRELGLWDETVVIFTADHGEYGGQFKCFYKGLAYEGSTHIPFIVRDPRVERRGRVSDRHVSNIDVFATCLRLAGVELPADTESRDLLPLVDGSADATWDNRVLFKARKDSMIVRDGLKLMRGEVEREVVYECYDLTERPLEAVNRIEDPSYAPAVARLRAELDPWHETQEALRPGAPSRG